jgi:hypothetical protein
MNLPARFRRHEELTEEEKESRYHNYHFVNLKGRDLKPLIKDLFRPVLKASGFNRVSDSLSVRVIEPHYVHCLQISFSSVYAGRFFVRAGVAIDVLPQSDWTAFSVKRINVDTDCLFTKNLTLPNGNPEFDNGTNSEEAAETIRYLISSFKDFDREYFGQFSSFPAPIDGLGVEFVQSLSKLMQNNSESEFGTWGATKPFFTLRLALIHQFLGNTRNARQLAEYGFANFELWDLKSRYEQLLCDIVDGPQSATVQRPNRP